MVAGRRNVLLRWLVTLVVLVFGLVVIQTTVVSVGRYCLTSDGGDTSALPRP